MKRPEFLTRWFGIQPGEERLSFALFLDRLGEADSLIEKWRYRAGDIIYISVYIGKRVRRMRWIACWRAAWGSRAHRKVKRFAGDIARGSWEGMKVSHLRNGMRGLAQDPRGRFGSRTVGFSMVALSALFIFLEMPFFANPQGVGSAGPKVQGTPGDPLRDPREVHLRHVRQLTSGGTNAEAYFSFDGRRLVFQATQGGFRCDQIFTMDVAGSEPKLVSTGRGRTTCGYFLPDNRHIVYASTHLSGADCPPRPDYSRGYVWPVYPTYQIFRATLDGRIVEPLTNSASYDAEATVSPDGRKMVFTSSRDGDLELYAMDLATRKIKRLTREVGYDGGAFYSPDSRWIVYRANHPSSTQEMARYRELLARNLVEPMQMELFVMRADGSERRQITRLGKANFAPYWLPDGKRIIFSSNFGSASPRQFELYVVDLEGGTPERITFTGGFNSFPMFSPDGKKLVFSSNRNAAQPREINVFIADWTP